MKGMIRIEKKKLHTKILSVKFTGIGTEEDTNKRNRKWYKY